jgi:hypothetical protein
VELLRNKMDFFVIHIVPQVMRETVQSVGKPALMIWLIVEVDYVLRILLTVLKMSFQWLRGLLVRL